MAKCGISISKESEAILLLDMTCPVADETKKEPKEKVKKEKVKKKEKEGKVKKEKDNEPRHSAASSSASSSASTSASSSSSSTSSSLSSGSSSASNETGKEIETIMGFGSGVSSMDGETGGRSNHSRMKHRDGMLLPSHLRPPLIVTIANSQNNNQRGSSGQGQDHELLVDILSNLKSSPINGADLSNDRKRSHHDEGGGGKRTRLEDSDDMTYLKSGEPLTPTERALNRVRLELAHRNRDKKRRDKVVNDIDDKFTDVTPSVEVNLDQDGGIIPFQLLPFFKYLDDYAQR